MSVEIKTKAGEQLSEICYARLEELKQKGALHDKYFVYERRLEDELSVYIRMGFCDLIFIIRDYCLWADANEVPRGPGRGSAAGSLVVYLTRITTIDPIRFGLLFERFLNPARVTKPDIDTDFGDRDRVITYLEERYGKNRVVKVGAFGLFKPKSAIDSFSRILGVDFTTTKRITKLIGDADTIDIAMEADTNGQLKAFEEEYPTLFKAARHVQMMPRIMTTHPSAVILTDQPAGRLFPLCTIRGEVRTQWSGEELDELGFVKLDILTVKNIQIVHDTIKAVGLDMDPNDIPYEDKKTFKEFAKGNTVGVFQFEEKKTIDILQKIKPTRFKDIYAVNALIRPGLDVDGFIAAKNSGVTNTLVPELDPILADTYGVIIYQEQVMKICRELAGFTMSEADTVRKVIAKTSNVSSNLSLNPLREKFIQGCAANGLVELHGSAKIEAVWDRILACGSYIFNLSHACVYTRISFWTMYLKTYYPLQFLCQCIINAQQNNREAASRFIVEARRLGIDILQPDINLSQYETAIEGASIRLGLAPLKGVGKVAKKIVNGPRPYENYFSFISQCNIKSDVYDTLAMAGCFDSTDKRDIVLKSIGAKPEEALELERSVIGFYASGDPLDGYDSELANVCQDPDLGRKDEIIGGLIIKVKEHTDKRGNKMCFLKMRTLSSQFDALLWSSEYSKCTKIMKEGHVIKAKGKRLDGGSYALFSATDITKVQNV